MPITPPEAEQIADEVHRYPLGTELDGEAVRLIRDVGAAELAELGVETAFAVSTGRVAAFLSEYSGIRVTAIDAVTRAAIASELAAGVAAGEGIRTISRRITKVFSHADKVRSRAIARTEVNSAAQFARYEAWVQSGVVEGKKWLATLDGRARGSGADHHGLHGKVVPITEAFTSNKGNRALYPGGFGVASEDINCRCALTPVVMALDDNDPLGTGRRSTTKTFDSRRAKWELRVQAAVRKGFRRQLRAVRLLAERLAD